MAIDTQALVNAMVSAGQNLGSTLLSQASSYALPEFTKIASQIVAIEFHSADYTEAGARALLDMQMRASAGVIVAMTSLVLLDRAKCDKRYTAGSEGRREPGCWICAHRLDLTGRLGSSGPNEAKDLFPQVSASISTPQHSVVARHGSHYFREQRTQPIGAAREVNHNAYRPSSTPDECPTTHMEQRRVGSLFGRASVKPTSAG